MNKFNFQEVNLIVSIIKLLFISICTVITTRKMTKDNKLTKTQIIFISLGIFIVAVIAGIIRNISDFLSSNICLIMSLSILYANITKNKMGYTILVTTISLSINYIILLIAIIVDFILNNIFIIRNDYINLFIILSFYTIFVGLFFKIRKFKQGFSFLRIQLENEYLDVLVLNISIILLFLFVMITNFDIILKRSIFVWVLAFSIIMFITIQKSLQLYYKQKLLIQDLNETKEELQKKNKEIEQLEKENLNFSKTSHSIAHKQKSLEYKLNQLMLKNETASEIDIKERIDSISKQIYNETTEIELVKTNIIEIDDILKYMQSECIKHKIDFQVQLSGNIYQMINNHISKEKLEILIADHIKNAIIAINYSENTNKSILVRLGMINGFYSLYVYDSGIEFEIDTLLNLGKRPSTTHADNGGTGMGFMNTFDTLREYKASMIIAEYNKPCKDNYTKVIKIKFDKKNEFKVCSYRSEEIKNKDTENNLLVEKLS